MTRKLMSKRRLQAICLKVDNEIDALISKLAQQYPEVTFAVTGTVSRAKPLNHPKQIFAFSETLRGSRQDG